MLYFTSDTHLGHKNIISHCQRPFYSMGEMDEALIANWNDRVTDDDTVYILGDLMFFTKDPQPYLERLRGHKHLIRGNHDITWIKTMEKKLRSGEPGARDYREFFDSVQDLLDIKLDVGLGKHTRMVLCHFPLMSWNNMEDGSYHLHGHIHNSVNAPYWSLLHETNRALNVGVDINDFRPVTFAELLENNRRFKAANPPR